MKGSSLWGLLSPIVVIALVGHNVEALSPSETCKLVKNQSFIADPADCQGWYYCLNGEAYGGKCGSGLLYNSFTASCDYPNNVQCAANVTTMCAGLNAVYKRDPSGCQGYCYCTNGVTECASCPTGQWFDATITECVYPSAMSVPCDNDSPCLLVENTFMKNPNSCDGWYRCSNGQIAAADICDDDLYYDALAGMCNYQKDVPCDIVITSPTDEPTPDKSCEEEGQFLPDPTSCRGYFYCDNDKKPHWGQCPEGSQFSYNNQTCTHPYNVDPPCLGNRCEGMSLTFMAVVDTNCANYTICTDGVSKGSYLCGDGLYLNEEEQGCQKSIPDLNICNVDTSSDSNGTADLTNTIQ